MAAWQYDLYLVPPRTGDRALERDRVLEARLPAGYADRLTNLLPHTGSWHADLQLWGAEDGHCIQVWRVAHQRSSIMVRVDVRAAFTTFLAGVVEFAVWAHLVSLQVEGQRPISPDVDWLSDIILGSRAARYVADPAAYLRRVKVGGWEDA
jgi:hypothetical protein